jgi:hypothetical protein
MFVFDAVVVGCFGGGRTDGPGGGGTIGGVTTATGGGGTGRRSTRGLNSSISVTGVTGVRGTATAGRSFGTVAGGLLVAVIVRVPRRGSSLNETGTARRASARASTCRAARSRIALGTSRGAIARGFRSATRQPPREFGDVVLTPGPRDTSDVETMRHVRRHVLQFFAAASVSIEELKLISLRLHPSVLVSGVGQLFLSASYNLLDPPFAPIDTFDALRYGVSHFLEAFPYGLELAPDRSSVKRLWGGGRYRPDIVAELLEAILELLNPTPWVQHEATFAPLKSVVKHFLYGLTLKNEA